MQGFQIGQIHPTAIISDKVKLSADVTIGANVIIYDNVEIEEKVFVGPNSILGEPLSGYYRDRDYENPQLLIGRGSILRAGAFLYAGSKIGEGFQCGTKVTIREGARLGHHCSVGSYSDLEGNCVIGDYVRLHSSVHIAQKTVIGSYVWVFPYTLFTNDPIPPSDEFVGARVEDFAVIASKVVIMPGVNIGKDALVSAMSLVQTDVPAETVVVILLRRSVIFVICAPRATVPRSIPGVTGLAAICRGRMPAMRIGAAKKNPWKFPVSHRRSARALILNKPERKCANKAGRSVGRAPFSLLVKRCALASDWRLPSPSVSTRWGVARIGCV
jgi:UDP-3-O-[3-hydroxymyristoyl] glucosamine N-acyltransferase